MATTEKHLPHRIHLAFFVMSLEVMAGSEKVVYDIISKLDQKRFKLFVFSFEDGLLRDQYETMGVHVEVIPRNGANDIQYARQFRQLFHFHHIDIVNAHHFKTIYWTTLAIVGTPIHLVYTEHSTWELKQLSLLLKTINRFFFRRASAIVAISGQLHDYYIHHLKLPSRKVHLIKNGIDLDLFDKRSTAITRESLSLNQDAFIIGTVANIKPLKNHKLLIAAHRRLIEAYPNMELVFVGRDLSNGEVQQYAKKCGLADKVHFLGARDDVPQLLKLFDLFCLPSQKEGLPLSVLEAMAAGLPVIGADVVGINEVIQDNTNGLLFESGNESALAEAITRMINNLSLRSTLAQSARRFVANHYSLARQIQRYEILFSNLIR